MISTKRHEQQSLFGVCEAANSEPYERENEVFVANLSLGFLWYSLHGVIYKYTQLVSTSPEAQRCGRCMFGPVYNLQNVQANFNTFACKFL